GRATASDRRRRRWSPGVPPCTRAGRSGSWASPGYLVREDDLGMDGTRAELELLRLLVEDGKSRHIGREQVWGELDAPEGAANAATDGLGEHRLADTGHVLDQDVTLAQQCDERHADFEVLADDDALDVRDHALCRLLDVLHR